MDSYRVIHDATHGVSVNSAIKVRDQILLPWGRGPQASYADFAHCVLLPLRGLEASLLSHRHEER